MPQLTEIYGLDIRSLALFRVCLALILLVDIRIRLNDLWAFYSDWGVLPRVALIENVINPFKLSFHLANGFGLFQGFLMVLAFVIALALLVGYRTRLATVLSWLFLYSLQSRNPVIVQGGDSLIRISLFWAIFLPLGAAYSLDRALDPSGKEPPQKIFSGASVALFAQVMMVYWFTAAMKNGPDWILDRTAIYYALNLELFERPFGQYLLNFPHRLEWLTWLVLWFERLGPFLLVTPVFVGLVRTIGVFLFVLLHVGMGSAMRVGPFPLIGITTALVFLPSDFWNWILPQLWPRASDGLKIFYDGDCGFCKKSVLILRAFFLRPDTPVLPAQSSPEIEREMLKRNSWVTRDSGNKNHYKFDAFLAICRASPLLRPFSRVLGLPLLRFLGTQVYETIAGHRAGTARIFPLPSFRPMKTETPRWADRLAVILIVYVLIWNLSGMGYFMIPKPLRVPAWVLGLDQGWGMFAPTLDHDGGWHIFYARLRDGSEVDLFRGGRPIDWKKPSDPSNLYKNERWRKYMTNINHAEKAEMRPYLADYLCLKWNRRQKDPVKKIERVEIYFMKEPTPPVGLADPPPKKVLLWGQDCPSCCR